MQVIENESPIVFPGLIKERGPVHAIVIGINETYCGEVTRILNRAPALQFPWVEEDLKKALAHLIICDKDICHRALQELMANNHTALRAK